MKLAKEPKEVDFLIKSEPWTEKDAADFSLLIQEIKRKNRRKTITAIKRTASTASIKKQSRQP